MAAKQRHLQATLSGYGRGVVREMRALAAERDKTQTQSETSTSTAGSEAKSKPKKKKVAHIVDKMLFNYRNIGAMRSFIYWST